MSDDPALSDPERFGQILMQARNGDAAAAGQLFMRFRPALLRFANHKLSAHLKGKTDASDLVQTVFQKAFATLAQFRGGSEKEMKAWLAAFLLHEVAHLNRDFSPGSKRDVGLEETQSWGDDSEATQSPEPESQSPSPCDDAQTQEWDEAFRLALHQLPEDIGQLLQLKILDGLSFEEMGQQFGISGNAARKRFDRAIDKYTNLSPTGEAQPSPQDP